MRKLRWRNRNRRLGGALLELAVSVPVLMLIVWGTVDFGRAFYYSVTVSNAAETGAFFGSQDLFYSGRHSQSSAAATQDASDVGTVTVTSDRVCLCPNGASVNCVTGNCTGYGAPRVYARCNVERTFNTLVNLPDIPDLFTVRRRVFMRVQ